MKQSVTIKSGGQDLRLKLDPSVPFEVLIKDICSRFFEGKKFFGRRSMMLSLEGRPLTDEEIRVITEAIELNSDLSISIVFHENEVFDAALEKKKEDYRKSRIYMDAQIINKSVKERRDVSVEGSLVIMGDVRRGARVRATGNVIVLGTLSGSVDAGWPENRFCYIAANAIDHPKHVSVGGVTGRIDVEEKWFKRLRRDRTVPTVLAVFDHRLIAEPLTSGILSQITGKWE